MLHQWRRICLNFIFLIWNVFLTCDVRNLTNENKNLLRKVVNRLPFEIQTEKHFRAVKTIRFARGLFQCFIFTRFRLIANFFGSVTYGDLQRLQLDLVSDHQTCELSLEAVFISSRILCVMVSSTGIKMCIKVELKA